MEESCLIKSPLGLIQEDLRDDPWKLLIACIMLNQTSIFQVRGVIWKFFERFPRPSSIDDSSRESMEELIRPLGLYKRRTTSIIKMSKQFSYDDKALKIDELPGVGKYAFDSYSIFVLGNIDVVPTDKKLIAYLAWLKGKTCSS